MKVGFEQTLVYCFNLLEHFGGRFKYPLKLTHINSLWHMPHVFDFLKKPREIEDKDVPIWKRKYYKKLDSNMIKGILSQILEKEENVIPTLECLETVDELIISYNL